MKTISFLLATTLLFFSCSSDENSRLNEPNNEYVLTESIVELGVAYGPESLQFLDIYKAASECPTPIYFDAHENGGTTAMPSSIIEDLNALGITVIAWESLPAVNSPEEVAIGWNDAELMFEWVINHADTYNLDVSNMLIGGSSRGSILSWIYGHRPNPNIKGLYMYNALPGNAWNYPDWWLPTENVNLESPPIYFVYRREPGSSTDLIDPDIHDPNNGITIMDQYGTLGIGDRATLVHSIGETDNSDKYQFLIDFTLSVLETCP
ncbi:MAG: hypothetical protein AAGH81_14075 [Bacteroidota bacterium]